MNDEVIQNRLEAIENKLGTLCAALLGDPTDRGNVGVIVRLDRLEMSNIDTEKIENIILELDRAKNALKFYSKIVWATVSMVLAAIIATIISRVV